MSITIARAHQSGIQWAGLRIEKALYIRHSEEGLQIWSLSLVVASHQQYLILRPRAATPDTLDWHLINISNWIQTAKN
jgi:hypothetical protein